MIKFFRNTKRKLIDKGNWKRYLVYATGEIILVVIGILLAVQLNNWNQTRVTNAETEQLLNKIEEDLMNNIKATNNVIEDYAINDSLTRKVIKNEVTIEDYYNDKRLGDLLFRVQLLKLSLDNINKLIQREEVISFRYRAITEITKALLGTIAYNEYSEEPVKSFYSDNVDFLMSSASWMAMSDSLSIQKRYHFFITDDNYKKRVLNYWAKTAEMALTTMYHRSISIQLLAELKVTRHNYDATRLKQLLSTLNLNSFKEIGCQDVVLRNKNQFYKNERFLVMNMSKEQIHILVKNSKNETIREKKIKPGGYFIFMETLLEFAPIDGDYFNTLELRQGEQCIKKYVEVNNGYLLVE